MSACCKTEAPADEEMQWAQQTLEHRTKLIFFLSRACDQRPDFFFFKYQNLNESLDHCFYAFVLYSEWLFSLPAIFKRLMFIECLSYVSQYSNQYPSMQCRSANNSNGGGSNNNYIVLIIASVY